jgi:hypothetical protein
MFVFHLLADFVSSLAHFVSFSMAVTRLAANDPAGAIRITVVGVVCVLVFAVVIIATEVAKVEARRYARKREDAEEKKKKTMEDKDAK